ncbi:MAG: CHAT domain-containing protein [Cyanobacteria bacterium P01_D01_bin.73]
MTYRAGKRIWTRLGEGIRRSRSPFRWLAAITLGFLIAIAQGTLQPTPSTATDNPSFVSFCESRARADADARYTVELMLKQAGTDSCATAADTLSQQPGFSSQDPDLRDVYPITLLNHWQSIMLTGNRIENIEPLATLPKVEFLIVAMNQVQDISPLGRMPSLKTAVVEGNRIESVPATLRSPTLKSLNLLNNPLQSKVCPLRPAQICLFSDGAAEEFSAGEKALDEGDFEEAIAAYSQAQAIYEREEDPRRLSRTYDRLGDIATLQGNFSDALNTYQVAYQTAEDLEDKPLLGMLMTSQAELYERLGQYEQATNWLLQAQLNAQQQEADPIPLDGGVYQLPSFQGEIARWMGRLQLRQGDRREALKQAQASLKYYGLLPDGYPGKSSGLRRSWTLQGEVQRQLNLLDQSLVSFRSALAFAQEAGDRPGESIVFQQQGLTYMALQRWEQAEASLDRAVMLAQNSGAQVATGQALTALGQLSIERKNKAKAINKLRAAANQWEALRPGLTDENKISLADAQADTYTWLVEALLGNGETEEALVAAERARARAFVELLANRLNPIPFDKSMDVNAVMGDFPRMDQAIQQAPLTLSEIKQLARDRDLTVVEYAIGHQVLHSWVVKPNGKVKYHPLEIEPPKRAGQGDRPQPKLSTQEALEKRLLDVRFSLTVPGNFFEEERATLLLRGLYQDLIEPLERDLPKDPNKPVLIVPQGKLFLLPFAALKPGQGRYLIEDHAIFVSPAIQASVLKAKHASDKSKLGMAGTDPSAVVVGNPIMPSVPPRVGASPEQLESLPGAEREAETISELLQAKPLLGADATKEAILDRVSNASTIHLATHGLLDDLGTAGVPGAIALTPTETDSGLWRSPEIINLQLNADLVVLSACNTGNGRVTGDGVVGLARSFAAAGAQSTVVSIWKVPDEPTATLMTDFYRQLQEGQSKADALRHAMLTTRETYPQPYNWSAFMLLGESA